MTSSNRLSYMTGLDGIRAVARDALPRLKQDIPAALFYITNWVYIVREVPYFEAFGRPPRSNNYGLWLSKNNSICFGRSFYFLCYEN